MKNILSIQSHVVFGHAGNSAAVFPMRRMGVNVWPFNTVQFSNHTQYGRWTGCVIPAKQLSDIIQGIDDIGQLKNCDAILSGYIGSAEQGKHILDAVERIKATNPKAIYFCDPVMGHPEKGCFVAEGVAEFFIQSALPKSDMLAPNILELEQLTQTTIMDVEQAVLSARILCGQGPELILVKHLSRAGKSKNKFEMLLVTKSDAWHIQRPLIDFGSKQPVGVGDLTSGLFLSNLLLGKTLVESFEHVTAAVYEVMLETHRMKQYELQLVAAQDRLVHPQHLFTAVKL